MFKWLKGLFGRKKKDEIVLSDHPLDRIMEAAGEDACDKAWAECAVRAFVTGKPHVANQRDDGTWIVEEFRNP